jgi:hypothetical protein
MALRHARRNAMDLLVWSQVQADSLSTALQRGGPLQQQVADEMVSLDGTFWYVCWKGDCGWRCIFAEKLLCYELHLLVSYQYIC